MFKIFMFAPVYVGAQVNAMPVETERGHWVFWSWSYRELNSSPLKRAGCAFKGLTISLALQYHCLEAQSPDSTSWKGNPQHHHVLEFFIWEGKGKKTHTLLLMVSFRHFLYSFAFSSLCFLAISFSHSQCFPCQILEKDHGSKHVKA